MHYMFDHQKNLSMWHRQKGFPMKLIHKHRKTFLSIFNLLQSTEGGNQTVQILSLCIRLLNVLLGL